MAFDKEIVALTIFCEASNSSSLERRAIAHVIKNRIPRFGDTQAEVCLRRYQFSEWNDDKINNSNLLRGAKAQDNNSIIKDCLAAYTETLTSIDMTKGATHYHDKTISPPYWTQGATMTLETQDFFFYKDVK